MNSFTAGTIMKGWSCTFMSTLGSHGAFNGWIGLESCFCLGDEYLVAVGLLGPCLRLNKSVSVCMFVWLWRFLNLCWPLGLSKRLALVDEQLFGESHGGWYSRVSHGNEHGAMPNLSQQSLTKRESVFLCRAAELTYPPQKKYEIHYQCKYTLTLTHGW